MLEEVDPARWDERLDALGITDVYWRAGYLRASALLTPAEPVLLHLAGDGGDVVLAGLVRADPADVVTPYGYGGPLAVGDAPPLDAWPDAYAAWARTRGVVSTFAVLHPLAADAGLHVSPMAGTVAWDLGAPDLLAAMHKHHRRLVRRAEREGLVAVADAAPDDLDAFVALYEATMRRNAAAPFYFFGAPYWQALLHGVPLVRVDVRDADGALVASTLGMGRPPWLHYHLGAVADAGRGTGAPHLALLALARWGQANGYTTLHLGGGVGGRDDELLRYKRRFAPEGLVPARLGKAVDDAAAYAALTGSDAVDYDGFFPAYRDR